MKRLRVLTLLFFLAASAGYGAYKINYNRQEDHVSPVITFDSDELELKVEDVEKHLLDGVHAEDDWDGDVSDSLVVVSRSKFKSKGKCQVNYAVFDEAGNVGIASRSLTYKNYTSPRFALTEPLRFVKSTASYVLVDKVNAYDCLDGDISNIVKYFFSENKLHYDTAGVMDVTFQVTNSAGDTVELPLEMEVLTEESFADPYPILSDYLVYTSVDEPVNPAVYLIGVQKGNSVVYKFDEEEIDGLANTLEARQADTFATTSDVNMRVAGDSASQILRTLKTGTIVERLAEVDANGWMNITIEGTEGFVKADYLVPADAPSETPEPVQETPESAKKKKQVKQPYTLSDIIIDESGVDYSRPGIYKIRYSLSTVIDEETMERESLGGTNLFVVVEE